MEHVQTERHGAALVVATVKAGIVAGLLGGLAMAAWLMVFTWFTGRGVLTPLKLFGGLFYGRNALAPGLGPAFWGLVAHLALSAALGVLFAAIFHREVAPLAEVASAIVYALLAWVLLTFVVLPVVNPLMREAVPSLSMAWFGAHVVYGGVLGVAQQLRRAVDA